jgi:hypothetical protein
LSIETAAAAALAVAAVLLIAPAGQAQPGAVNDYPTAVRAEYVFACMTTHGGTQEALQRCACAIDVIAAAVPYSEYEKAETVLRMRRVGGGGYLAQEFRTAPSDAMVQSLEEAQAEADVSCF